jgi:hypothetical protein
MEIKRIETRDELAELARELHVPSDWHEVSQVDVSASVHGRSFDNAGYWGAAEADQFRARYSDSPALRKAADAAIEMWVSIEHEGETVAEVNLATLFAFATGWEG